MRSGMGSGAPGRSSSRAERPAGNGSDHESPRRRDDGVGRRPAVTRSIPSYRTSRRTPSPPPRGSRPRAPPYPLRPSSAATLVMTTPWMPQGTMRSNPRRSVLTLSAKPWSVTHCFTWMPMLAILRPARPHAGEARVPLGGDAERGQRVDQRRLELAQVPVQVLPVLAQVEDRIADQLARPVVGHVAAALDLRAPRRPAARAPPGRAAGCVARVPRPSVTTGSCSTSSSRSSCRSPGHALAGRARAAARAPRRRAAGRGRRRSSRRAHAALRRRAPGGRRSSDSSSAATASAHEPGAPGELAYAGCRPASRTTVAKRAHQAEAAAPVGREDGGEEPPGHDAGAARRRPASRRRAGRAGPRASGVAAGDVGPERGPRRARWRSRSREAERHARTPSPATARRMGPTVRCG